MKDQSTLGMNRTGMDIHKSHAGRMLEISEEMEVDQVSVDDALEEPRSDWAQEAGSVGSIPIPGKIKGAVKMGAQMMKGVRPQALVDKLGERLAFERTGVRLYDALITKCENSNLGMDVDQLRQFRKEEAEHFMLVKNVMDDIGADPTAVTPSADVMAVASIGLVQVISDPRTTPTQALQTILIAELADNDGWELLIDLTDKAGMSDVTTQFRNALAEEEKHLIGIRAMVQELIEKEGALLQ